MKGSKNDDLVSVVIPAYNVGWCIEKAIESALSQTYPHLEIIVVNDGSTDNTATVLQKYRNRIRILTQSNAGLSNARNRGIRSATGEFVAFLDADDYWLPMKLERQVALLRERPEIGFCSTATRVESLDGTYLSEWSCPEIQTFTIRTIYWQNSAIAGSGSSVMVRRNILLKTELFDESLKSLEDIDMWMRLAAITEYACIPEPLSVILRHDDSMSKNFYVMRASALHVMKKNRYLLDRESIGGFWQAAYGGVLADYAKWEYRTGQKRTAIFHLIEGLCRSPVRRGRLMVGLLIAMLKGDTL